MLNLERPILAVDVVLFSVFDGALVVLTSRRDEEPFKGHFSLPGVAMRIDEPLLDAAKRALMEKAKLDPHLVASIHLEQLAAFDSLFRDPRGRTVCSAFLALCAYPSGAVSDDVLWQQARRIPRGSLPFDHEDIITEGVKRLKGKLRYTNIASRLLPDRFHLESLHELYEVLLGKSLNKSNFRTKLLKIGFIERVGRDHEAVTNRGGRPPHLYRFINDDVEPEDRDFV